MKNQYKTLWSFLLCIFTCTLGFAQQTFVTGTVTDAQDTPLPGVNVIIKGTRIGTVTDFDGNYEIEASEGDVLTFSYVGMEPIERSIGASSTINVSLKESNSELEEVVVIGYGTQKKVATTGSIATLKTDNFVERPISRVDQGLIGQIAGVRVKQTTGLPGRPFSINIRGTGSISAGNEPLYVIDGFPLHTEGVNQNGSFSNGSPLDNINPNDIESIEILKDAAAAAIYGSRASNGVVLITTKKGKTGNAKFTFNAYTGISKESKRVDMLSPDEWIGRSKIMIDNQWMNSGVPGATTDQSVDQRRSTYNQFLIDNNRESEVLAGDQFNTSYMYDPRWDMEGHPGLDYIDWQDRIFRTGIFNNFQLSASGATEAINYYISGNYQKNEGYIIGTDYEAFSARANIDIKFSDRLKMGINLAPTYSVRNDPGVEGKDNTLHKAISTAPIQESTTNDSGEKYTIRYDWGSSNTDPLPRLSRKGKYTMFRNLISSYVSYDIMDGLTIRSSVNFDNADNTSETYLPNDVLESIRGDYGTYRRQNIVNENTLTYTNTFKDNHNLSVILGHSYNRYQITSSGLSSGNRYNNSTIETLPSGSTGSTSSSRNVLISYFGRAQYDFKEKYMLSASIRWDGSSKFGPDSRWGVFPSVSGGWRISQEEFMQNISWLSELKLRASYGINGSNNIGNYAWYSTLGAYNYFLGQNTALGQGVASIPNPSLHWEESRSSNFGLDFSVLNNRISGSFDVYRKENSDLLLQVPAPAASGFTSYLENVGKVLNKGWEAEITSYNLTGDFSWNTSFNISHNANEVLALGPEQDRIEISSGYSPIPFIILEVGKPMYTIHTIVQDGVLSEQDVTEGAAVYGGGTPVAGDPKYVDQNDDGVIDEKDRVDAGNPFPKYIWGITNNFRYKNFDLNVLLQGQNGGHVYGLLGRAINRTGMSSGENNLDVDPAKRGNWKTNFGYVTNTDWLYKSDYLSIRNITLGYNLTNALKSEKIDNARVYVTAENWFYWDKYDGGYNPEATNAPASSDSRYPVPADYGGAPLAKSLILGLNITFN
ncbi:SusC/RagA family TonB-linked outer membrane protein [Sinomicrobium sp. M5D2P9]